MMNAGPPCRCQSLVDMTVAIPNPSVAGLDPIGDIGCSEWGHASHQRTGVEAEWGAYERLHVCASVRASLRYAAGSSFE